jgi:4'-phosphopantetheinyl transferase
VSRALIRENWLQVGAVPELTKGEAAIWQFDPEEFSQYAQPFENILSVEETRRLDRFVNIESKREYVLCRGMLRYLLAKLHGQSPESLVINTGRQGKPEIVGEKHEHSISFNISHTENLCLIAFGRGCEVGVDVEKVHAIKDLPRLAQTYLSPEEIAAWRKLDAEESGGKFVEFWCAKEAILKAAGCGLTIHPSQVNTFEALSMRGVRGIQENGCFFEFLDCRLEKLPLEENYRGWLAVFGELKEVRLFQIKTQFLVDFPSLDGRKVEK